MSNFKQATKAVAHNENYEKVMFTKSRKEIYLRLYFFFSADIPMITDVHVNTEVPLKAAPPSETVEPVMLAQVASHTEFISPGVSNQYMLKYKEILQQCSFFRHYWLGSGCSYFLQRKSYCPSCWCLQAFPPA